MSSLRRSRWRTLAALGLVLALLAWLAHEPQGDGAVATTGGATSHRTKDSAIRQSAEHQAQLIGANHEAWREGESLKVAPVEWSGEPHGSGVRLSVGVAWCPQFRAPWIDRVQVMEAKDAVILTAYVAYPPPHRPDEDVSCAAVMLDVPYEVDLGRPLGDRSLLDGFRWPPIKRWPLG